jgi:hypothetical protein
MSPAFPANDFSWIVMAPWKPDWRPEIENPLVARWFRRAMQEQNRTETAASVRVLGCAGAARKLEP